MKIGFIGLGIMGKPMCKNLIKHGYDLVVYDICRPSVDELVSVGAAAAESNREVAENSDVIITMLPNSPHVTEAIFGRDGICEGVKENALLIDMSSINPMVSKDIAARLAEKKVRMLDAPVSGGEPKAIDGTLSIMVGGKEEDFQEALAILKSMGAFVTLVGDIGSGNTAKLANQIVVALNIAAVSEALLFSQKAGCNPEKVFQAIRGGLAGSTVMDAKAPMMLNRNFKPGFRIELHIKDLLNAVDAAEQVEYDLLLTVQVLQMLQMLASEDKGKSDHSALIQYYEKLSGFELKK
jgi:2-hydroxy-3-oxopropionate reductase